MAQPSTCRALNGLAKRRRLQSPIATRLAGTIASSTNSTQDLEDLDSTSFGTDSTLAEQQKPYNPVAGSRSRRQELPRSRYQFRPPKYYRGPLHPHQPPPPSDPSSREFVPGPFSSPRLEQTYNSTIASDIMALSYQHYPPGYEPKQKAPRLRSWDDSSPYHKNRPLRGPRGGDVLGLLRKRITFRNVPRLESIVVHSFVREALENESALHVAAMALQSITGVRVQSHQTKHNEVAWNIRDGKYASITSTITGEDMYHFLSKVIDVVLPRIRDWRGVKGSSGDDNGNISFGLTPDMVALFPEIEVNYDAYPPKLIPGCHITIHTSATTDRDARLLLTAFGIPFYGKLVD